VKKNLENTHLPLESLACVNQNCEDYGLTGLENLYVRKIYGKDHIRYLRCRTCQEEFSERKNTTLWNVKIRERKAISIAEHLSEGNSIKGTSRLLRVDPSTVRRLNKKAGQQSKRYHDEKVQKVNAKNLQADERHGFVAQKNHPSWEAELMDVESKFVLSHVQGSRNEQMIRALLEDSASRLLNPHEIALLTDGDAKDAATFPEVFGQAYQPARKGVRGRFRKIHYRIPRCLAHVQVIKHRENRRLKTIEIRYTHGSKKRIDQALDELGYNIANTSAIERRNGTARSMSKAQVRKTLAFAKREEEKTALGWWATTVYNWCREHRSLREELPVPQGKKSIDNVLRLWLSD
jgi:IS1 family transposase/transposase-like protein